MPYEPEEFKPPRPVRASRKATAQETQEHVLEFLRGMTCPITALQVSEGLTDKGVKVTLLEAQRALKNLLARDRVIGWAYDTWTFKRGL